MGLVLASTMSFSQVIVSLTSVPCNTGLEGNYPYEYAGELDGSDAGWNEPNIFLGANAVSGCLEFIDDGTPGMVTGIGVPPLVGVPMGYLGCDTAGNASQDLTGKIAVIYRGSCEFGYKAYKRGAVAVIIINHTGDAVGMAGGAYGTQVNIPVVQIGRIAGDDLRLAIESCGACTVTAFIGSKVVIYSNDMGSSIADIVMPNELAKPQDLATTGAEYPVDLGFWAFNYGTNAQTGVTASVNIDFAGSSVYSNTSAPLNFAAPAGIVVDTQYFDLGTFAPATLGVGTYTVTYTLNLAGADDEPTDNVYTYSYNLNNAPTTNGDVYAKSRTDVAANPITSSNVSPNESTTLLDDWEACIVFRDANVGSRNGSAVGMTFSATPAGYDIDFEVVEVRLYQWNNVFVDMNDTALAFWNVSQLASGTYFYDYASNGNLEGQNIYVPFDVVPPVLTNNQRYLFCVYTASDSVRIGYDARIDYTATINNYLQPICPLKTLPNGGSATWYRDGFGWDLTPAISAVFDINTSVNTSVAVNHALAPYPNPAVNMLTVPVRKGIVGNVRVEIYDLAGKLVISENQTIGNEPLKVNVASIANGAYVFNLTFADGSKDTFKVSVNR